MREAPSEGVTKEDKQRMKLFSVRGKRLASIISLVVLGSMILAACGSANTGSSGSTPTTNGNGGKGCKKIGVSLPETASSNRWDGFDRPLLEQMIPQMLPGATVDYANAEGNADTQQTQADAMLTKGDCILVVAANDSIKAARIVADAKADGVPVIAYDRLIQSNDLAYYVSFDNVQVGVLQGTYIKNHYQQYVKSGKVGNTVMIDGAQTDNNALLFSKGAHSILDPLFSSGVLKNVYEKFTPNWDNPTAQTEMEAALTANGNNIQIAYVANDGMATTVIAALKAQHLNGKVLVTGQDATLTGLQNILLGDQSMTVLKPYKLEAGATASLVAAISNGSSTSSLVNGQVANANGVNIPSILETPEAIDKTNVMDVINTGEVTLAQVCQGMPSKAGGICP
jgi:D-xylose transport system substrate-binding protein